MAQPTVTHHGSRLTGEVTGVEPLDLGKLVKVAVGAEDAREAILKHHASVQQIAGFECRVALSKPSDLANVRQCDRQGCRYECLQVDTDLSGLLGEA